MHLACEKVLWGLKLIYKIEFNYLFYKNNIILYIVLLSLKTYTN